jgi:hypothetical protein
MTKKPFSIRNFISFFISLIIIALAAQYMGLFAVLAERKAQIVKA